MDEDVRNKKRKDAERHYQFGLVFVRRKNSLVYKIESHEGEEDCDNHSPTVNVRSAIPVDLKVSLRDKAIKWLEILLGVATFVVLVYYTHATFIQSEAAIKSAIAAKSAADTAASTLKNQQESFEIDQRPYLVADTPQFSGNGQVPDKPITANITLKNIGRTPANRYLVNVALLRFEPGEGGAGTAKLKKFVTESFAKLESSDARGRKETASSGAEADLAPNGSYFTSAPQDPAPALIISASDFPKIQTANVSLFFFGVATYTDSFNRPYTTEFCYFFFGGATNLWHICDHHNIIK